MHWQQQELEQAQRAFDLSDSRYQAGAETLLTVLETQRTLYAAQDAAVQLRLARLQASVGLYKALGGGWQSDRQGLARGRLRPALRGPPPSLLALSPFSA